MGNFSSKSSKYILNSDTAQKVSTSSDLNLFQADQLETHYSKFGSCLQEIRGCDPHKNMTSLLTNQNHGYHRAEDSIEIFKFEVAPATNIIKDFVHDVTGGFELMKFRPAPFIPNHWKNPGMQSYLEESKRLTGGIFNNPYYYLLESNFIRAFKKEYLPFVSSLLAISINFSEILVLYSCEFYILRVVGMRAFTFLYNTMHKPNEFISVLRATMTHLANGSPTDGYNLFTNYIYEKRFVLSYGFIGFFASTFLGYTIAFLPGFGPKPEIVIQVVKEIVEVVVVKPAIGFGGCVGECIKEVNGFMTDVAYHLGQLTSSLQKGYIAGIYNNIRDFWEITSEIC